MLSTRPRSLCLAVLGLACALAGGCASPERFELRKILGKGCEKNCRPEPVVEREYRLGCRDVVEVGVPGQSGFRLAVQPDGTIPLGPIRAEGLTTNEVASRVALKYGLARGEVRVSVREYRSGRVYVFGLVQGEPNAIQPGKRMLSSMTPTIVVKDGALRAVVGTPGGPTITTTVVQIIRAVIDYGLSIDEAVAAVRVHHQWLPDRIATENRISPELEAGLKAKGHEVQKWGQMGHANCIEVDPATKGFRAVADVSRDGGKAVAY